MFASPAAARAFAWGGAALFAGSLGYFLFSFAVTFGDVTPGPVSARAIAADAALFTAFALHHSLFARERVRARVARLLPPPLERSAYVWAASLMLIAVCAWWQPVAGVLWRAEGPAAWGLATVQAAGLWLVVRSAAVIDPWELTGITSPSPSPHPASRTPVRTAASREFSTRAPYGWVRHPIYLGWYLLVLAVPAMTGTRALFAAMSCAYIVVAIPLEERSLRRSSGGAYDAYMKKVPRRLIPGLY